MLVSQKGHCLFQIFWSYLLKSRFHAGHFYFPFISRLAVLVQPSSLATRLSLPINSCITVYMKRICLHVYLVPSSLQHYYGIYKCSSDGSRGTHCRFIADAVNAYSILFAYWNYPCLRLCVLLNADNKEICIYSSLWARNKLPIKSYINSFTHLIIFFWAPGKLRTIETVLRVSPLLL